jgi:hypothetical protein
VIAFFDALHDLGDPVGAARHARAALAGDGSCLLVEPFAGDRIEENLNPLEAGFGSVRRAAQTPLNLVLEARA